MWLDLFIQDFDETIMWALKAVVQASIALLAVEVIVNKICDLVEKYYGKRIKIRFYIRHRRKIEL